MQDIDVPLALICRNSPNRQKRGSVRRKANIPRHQGTAVQFLRRNLQVCQAPYSAPCSTLPSCPSHRACPRSGGQAGFLMPLLYTTFPCRSSNALRCDGKCSALRRPTQHAAMTFAPRCDFCRTSLPDGKESDRIPSTTAFHLTRNRFYRQTRSNFKTEAKPFPEQEQNFSKTEAKPFPNNRVTIPRHAKSPPPTWEKGFCYQIYTFLRLRMNFPSTIACLR